MTDGPRKILIGTFPVGVDQILDFQGVESQFVADAAARAAAVRAAERAAEEERERAARQKITVDRAWFISTMKTLIAYMETERRWHAHHGDLNRRDLVAWKAHHLRNWLAENAEEPP